MKYQFKRILNDAKTATSVFVAALALSSLSVTAYAQQQAYTNKSVNLRAGPSTDYPSSCGYRRVLESLSWAV